MRIAVISDIHSNLEALRTALAYIDRLEIDAIYCLGDVVGYGADPGPCVDLVRERCKAVVLGNHDVAVATGEGLSLLPQAGQDAARHNRDRLSFEQIQYLTNLPHVVIDDNCTFVHASPDEPTAWKRLNTYPEAQEQFAHFETELCFIGHTHIPAVMSNRLGVLRVRKGNRYLINSGSIGQPRDNNPQLSFALFDTEAFIYKPVRLTYDIETAAEKIRQAGLPDILADRLYEGM